MLIKEEIVMGRSNEKATDLQNELICYQDGTPLLVENLLLTADSFYLPGIMAPSRTMGTIFAAG